MKKTTKADKVYAAAFDVIEAVGYADDMGRGGFNLAALKDRAASLVKQDAEERKRGGAFLPSCFLEVLDLIVKCSAPHNRAIPESLMNHAARIANAASDPKPEALAQAYGERVAEGKARAEQDNKETARQISETSAMKAAPAPLSVHQIPAPETVSGDEAALPGQFWKNAVGQWCVRLESSCGLKVRYFHRKWEAEERGDKAIEREAKLRAAQEQEFARMEKMNDRAQERASQEAASEQEQATLRHILAMPDQPLAEVLKAAAGKIDALGRELTASEQAHRFDAKEADKAVNELKDKLRHHEEARAHEEACAARSIKELREQVDAMRDRAVRAELALRKVCDALRLSPEQAQKIATGK